jgi:hypothetical protein
LQYLTILQFGSWGQCYDFILYFCKVKGNVTQNPAYLRTQKNKHGIAFEESRKCFAQKGKKRQYSENICTY